MPRGSSPLQTHGTAASADIRKDDVAAAMVEAGYPSQVAMESVGNRHDNITNEHFRETQAATKNTSPSPHKIVWSFMSPEAIVEACRRREFTPVMLYEHLISLIQTGTPNEKRWATERFCKSLKEICAFQLHLQEYSETRRTANNGDTVTEQSVVLRRVIADGMEQIRNGQVPTALDPALVSVIPPDPHGDRSEALPAPTRSDPRSPDPASGN